MRRLKWLRRVVTMLVVAGSGVLLAVFFCAQAAVGAMQDLIAASDALEHAQVVIVPGASVLRNGQPSDVLADRLLAAFDVYQAEKVDAILVSGDHGQDGYDEVNVMRTYLLELGVPPEDIFLDHAGFDTYDTMYRARHVFGVTSAVLSTQTFHLPRALYIGQAVGIGVQGVAAERQPYVKDAEFAFRERFANVKAYIDVIFGSEPAYLGATIDISGDGQTTWDVE